MFNGEVIQHGNTGIWRYKTAEDKLMEALEENRKSMQETKLMVERGWKKHTKFWGQEEAEEHQAALSDKSIVCYYCLAELEEKYGIEQALRQRVIKF